MGVLWWLAVPLGITALAMIWAGWVGRPRDERGRTEAARARLAAALAKPTPEQARRIVVQPPDPPRGVAVRPSTRSHPHRPTEPNPHRPTESHPHRPTEPNPRRPAG